MNARRHIESILPAFLLVKVSLRAITNGLEMDDDGKAVASAMRAFVDSRVAQVPERDRPTFSRRLERAADALLDPFVDRPIMVAFLSVHQWLSQLLESGTWAWDDDGLDKAIDAVLNEIARHEDLIEIYEKSGRKQGRRLMARAQQLGYFNG